MKTKILLDLTHPQHQKFSQQPHISKVHLGHSHEQLNTNFTNSNNNFTKWNTHGTNQQQHIQFNNNFI